MEQDKRPPLGLMPQWRHKELRLKEINEAMGRYLTKSLEPIPPEWIIEQNDLCEWLTDYHRQQKASQSLDSIEWEIVRVRNKYPPTDKTFDTIWYDGRKVINGQNYEYVLNCLHHKYTIEAVKRISDGEVFAIGDKVAYMPPKGEMWSIDNFFIGSNDIMLARSKDNLIVEVVDNNLFKMTEKVMPVLLTASQIYKLKNILE